MIEIGRLTPDQLPEATDLCEWFFINYAKYPTSFSRDKVSHVLKETFTNEDSVCFTLMKDKEVIGILVGGLSNPPFSNDLVATELAWFVYEDSRRHGLKLLKLFEQWASEKQASSICVAHMGNTPLDKVYERMGYEMVEKAYMRSV